MQALNEAQIERIDAPVRRQVEDRVREAIVNGRFAPGERLVESRLCEHLNVSRPIIREALRQLVAEGLVVIVPHRGARVASITAEEARQIYEVRKQLEGLAGQGFAKHASAAAIAELRAVIVELERAADGPASGHSILEIKQRFYAVMLAHCGNEIVRETLGRLNNRVSQLRALSLSQPKRLPQTLRELKGIVKAIEARDAAAAFEACARHVERAAKHALKALKARQDKV